MKLCIIFDQKTNQVLSWGMGDDSVLDGINIEIDDNDEVFEPFQEDCFKYEYNPSHNPCLVYSDECKNLRDIELQVEQKYNRLIELDKLRSGQALERYLLDDDRSGLEAIQVEAEACRVFIRENTTVEE